MTERTKPQSREEQAALEIGHTEIGRGVKWTLFAAGLLTLLAVPAAETYRDTRQHSDRRDGFPWPPCCDIFDALPRAAAAYNEHCGGWAPKALHANAVLLQSIDRYEKDREAESLLAEYVLPPVQELLVHAGSGNERAYIGRWRWLFYRPGIDYCTGPGFLDPRHLARRAGSGSEWRPAPHRDPRAAILQFHRQLADRKVRLVLMPTPGKATIHPEKFSSRYEDRPMGVHNPSYRPLLAELEAEGVLVCDPTAALVEYRDRSGNAVYLAADTHWRPEAMELAAAELARLIEEEIVFATAADRTWHRTARDVENRGDIAMMLRQRPNRSVFGEEAVTIRPVTDAAGHPWRPDPAAEILMLGDSFANIYSLELMNWGSAAGLAEQLSFALNRPVDAILRNGDGAYATRQILSRELAQGEDRLAGKKVVVWQYAARELAAGDWKLVDMTLNESRKPSGRPPATSPELIVSGTISAKSAAPRAGQMPYADHIFTCDLTDLDVRGGTLTESKIAVYLFSMRHHQNTPAFSWPVGKRVKLKLYPWRPHFFARYGRVNRTETEDIELKRPWWGEVIE